MEYKRYIEKSNEYKELINSIDRNINICLKNIYKLKEKQHELENEIYNNDLSINELDKKIDSIQDEIIENIRNDQRIKDAVVSFIPGLISSALFLAGANTVTGTDSTILTLMGSGIGAMSLITSTLIYTSPNHVIKTETEEKAMKKEKNIKLNEKMESYNLERSNKFEQQEKVYNAYSDIRNEIHKNIQENFKLQKEKEQIIALARNYDSINDYQKIFTPCVNEKYNEVKHLAKTLKRTKD